MKYRKVDRPKEIPETKAELWDMLMEAWDKVDGVTTESNRRGEQLIKRERELVEAHKEHDALLYEIANLEGETESTRT